MVDPFFPPTRLKDLQTHALKSVQHCEDKCEHGKRSGGGLFDFSYCEEGLGPFFISAFSSTFSEVKIFSKIPFLHFQASIFRRISKPPFFSPSHSHPYCLKSMVSLLVGSLYCHLGSLQYLA